MKQRWGAAYVKHLRFVEGPKQSLLALDPIGRMRPDPRYETHTQL
jgi:hypothetical protein